MTESSGIDRRGLLRAAGAAGLALGAGIPLSPARASAPRAADPSVDPWDLQFSVVEQHRPFDLLAPNFVELRDDFADAMDEDYDLLAPKPEGHIGHVEAEGGLLRFSGSDYFALLRSSACQRAPYASVIVQIDSFADTGGAHDTVVSGLVKNASNYVVGWYNHATHSAGVDVVTDGVVNTIETATAEVAAPCRLAFCLTGTTAVVLVDEGQGFRPLAHGSVGDHVDLRRPDALADYRDAFGARASTGTITIDAVEAGYFGQAGVRDPHVVTTADGRPLIRDGKVYLTFTQAGLAFFDTAHWGVWTLDLDTYALEQVANLFFQRDDTDAILGDHAGHIVLDEAHGRWIIAMSTWGDFAFEEVAINYVTVPTSTELLSGVHVLRTAQLPLPVAELPTSAVGQWDPHIVRIRGRWYVAFVNARAFFNFYPALAAAAPGSDFTDLELVGADPDKNETEGPIMQEIGGEWFLLASNGDASPAAIRGQYPVYDLAMTQVGTLDAPHPTNIPWPMVFPSPLPRGRTRWVLVTFNGTQYHPQILGYGTHGDMVVMEAEPITRP